MGDVEWFRLMGLGGLGLAGGEKTDDEDVVLVGGRAPGILVIKYGSTLESEPVQQ